MQAYDKKQINNMIAAAAKKCAHFLCVKWNSNAAISLLRKDLKSYGLSENHS